MTALDQIQYLCHGWSPQEPPKMIDISNDIFQTVRNSDIIIIEPIAPIGCMDETPLPPPLTKSLAYFAYESNNSVSLDIETGGE